MHIEFITIDDFGMETTHRLPAVWEVCPTCEGEGKHVNRNVDGHGITAEEFADDPDFAEDYFAGVYDVTCEECKGRRVVKELDRDKCPPYLLALYDQEQEDEAYYAHISAMERRMGA